MDSKEYIALAVCTEAPVNVPMQTRMHAVTRELHAVIGLATEVGEVQEGRYKELINWQEELGDLCWYAALLCDIKGWTFEELWTLNRCEYITDTIIGSLIGLVGRLQDCYKRHIFYGTELDNEKIKRLLGSIMIHIQTDHMEKGWDIVDTWDRNIRKLRHRFPNKFTEYDALHRDLDKEQEILKGN